MKKIIAIISLLLCMIVVVQSLPMSAYAEVLTGEADSVDSEQSSDTEVTVEEEIEEIVYIVGEDETQRDETTKVFRMSDGSYTAAVYPTQVHYEEDGEMKEIDNTLQSVDGDRFETKAGPVKISVPSSLSDEDAVEYSDGEHSVMFRLDTEKAAKGTRKAKEKKNKKINELSEAIALQDMADEDFEKIYGKTKDESAYLDNIDGAIEEHNQLMMTSEKLGSQITYGSVFNDTDLRYTVTGTTLKEEIILKTSAGIQKKYEFIIGSETLTPVLMDDNSVQLCDSDGNKIFEINSPYMYDAAGEISEDIKVSLKKNSDGTYTYTLKPDKKWLEDEERVYPIVIDPPISESDTTTVKDTTGYFASYASHNPNIIYVGRKNGSVEAQGMLYSELPTVLQAGTTKIINASLMLWSNGGDVATEGLQINAYRITSDWNTSNVKENSTLFLGSDGRSDYSDVLDYANVTSSTTGDVYTWDITEAAEEWQAGTKPNYGISLRAMALGSGVNYAEFIDSTKSYPPETNSQYAAVCPQFIYTYRDLRGVEDYWTFTSMGAGRFGTIGVNNYNGNPVITQPLVSSSGNNMPVSVSLIYSYNSQDSGKCGFGNWRTNYHMNIIECNEVFKIGTTEVATYKYCFIDSDGTKHYLKQEGSEHKDEDGLGLTMTVIDEYDHKYLIETKDKTKYKFDHYGRLSYIEDSNSNWNRIYFVDASDPNNQAIASIVEGHKDLSTRRQTDFVYREWNTDIYSPDGDVATVAFTSTAKSVIFGFYYKDSDWNSRSGATQIRWDSNSFPLAIYDGYGHRTYIESSIVNGVRRVTGMSYGTGVTYLELASAEPGLDMNNTLERYTFSYSTSSTHITDKQNRTATYQFNNYGHTESVVDHTTSWGQNYEYGVANNKNKGYENKLKLASKAIAPSINLIYGGNLNYQENVSEYSVYPSSTGYTIGMTGDMSRSASGSMIVTKPDSATEASFVSKSVAGLEPGNYTLSMYVSTNGGNLSGTGAYAQVSIYSGSFRTSSNSKFFTHSSAGEWVRLQTSFTIEQGDTHIAVGLGFTSNTHGTIYIDDLQLEKNITGGSANDNLSGAGSFNMLQNAKLTDLTGWYSSGFNLGGNTSYVADAPTAVHDAVYALDDTDNSYKYIYQEFYVTDGKKDDVYIAGGWAHTNIVPLDNNTNKTNAPLVGIYVTFMNWSTPVGEKVYVKCNPSVTDWQYLLLKAAAPADYNYVRYEFVFSYCPGYAAIGAPFLYRESYGQSYTYDENGNLISSTDAAETMAKFAYQNDALTSTLSPSGSKYSYQRDDVTNNIYEAFSNGGQKVELSYNETGDGTAMYISDLPVKGSLSNGESVDGYLVNAKTGHTLGAFGVSSGSYVYVGNHWSDTYQLMSIIHHEDFIYTIRMYNTHSLGLASQDLGNGDEYFQLGSVPYYGQGTTPVESLFKILPNGDGTYRILTGYSGYEKCIKMVEEKFDNNIYKIAANSAYDEDDLSNKWYIHLPGSDKMMTTSTVYTTDQNYLKQSTDQAGNTTRYEYDESAGLLVDFFDPNGAMTHYTYDEMRRTTSVSSALNDDTYNTVYYTYTNDNLTRISVNSGEVVYDITYNQWDQPLAITVGNGETYRNLLRYTYDSNNNLAEITYGNGDWEMYSYDSLDRLTEKYYYDTDESVYYYYDPNGNLYKVYDEFSDTQSITDYDLAGRVVGSTLTNETGRKILASANIDYHDKKGTVEGQQVTLYDDANGAYRTIEYEYTYGDITQGENPAALYEMLAGGRTFTYEYDGLGRLVKKALSVGSSVDETYTYITNGDNTTTLVETHKDMNGVTHTYTYDGNGNITEEIFGTVTRTYKYDKYNRLERYDDSGLGSTYLYYYDGRGNITSQAKYAYTTDSTENVKSTTPIETKTYAYGYDLWTDALTNFNGSSITYDYAMNPTAWTKGRTLSWENEKSLASISDGTNTATYTYNGDRLRTKKVTGSKTTEYYILDGTYVGEKTTVNGNTYRISYVYDENGAPTGLNIDGSACYFVKNLQGDVIALMGSDGGVFATYSYDAWGNIISIKDAYGAEVTNPGNYALLNPFRYRGYMYDDETGFYYLRSRYYDPEVGRFINADNADVLTLSEGPSTDKNLYAYCDNNPVTRADNGGEFWNVVIGAAIGGAINLVSSIASEAIKGDLSWDDAGKIAISTAIGMAEGAAIALCPAASAAISAVSSAADTAIIGFMEKDETVSVGDIITDSLVSGAIGAVAGSGGSDFVKGGQLINDAAGSVGNAIRKGVHPVVKKSARKTIKKAAKQIGRAYISGQVEDIAYGGLSKFSSYYTRSVIRNYRGR